MANHEEEKTPESEDILNNLEILSKNNPEIAKPVQRVIDECPKKQSNRDKMLEWLNKVKQTLSASNITKSLSAAGRKIVDGILKAVNYLIKIFKKERTEAKDLDKPKKTARGVDVKVATKIQKGSEPKYRKAVGKHSAAVLKQEKQNIIAAPAPKKSSDLPYRGKQKRKPLGASRSSISKGTGR